MNIVCCNLYNLIKPHLRGDRAMTRVRTSMVFDSYCNLKCRCCNYLVNYSGYTKWVTVDQSQLWKNHIYSISYILLLAIKNLSSLHEGLKRAHKFCPH